MDVPGPSSPRTGHHKRDANGARIDVNGETIQSTSDDEEEDEPIHRMLAPPEKRLRLLTAGLSRKDRARIKLVPKAMTHSRGLASGATSSLGWAGAGADMLEKKRKEEERRRTIEEKKRVKEVYTQIGAKDWKQDIVSSGIQIASVHERLSLCECEQNYKKKKHQAGCREIVRLWGLQDRCLPFIQQFNKKLQEHKLLHFALNPKNYLIWILCGIS